MPALSGVCMRSDPFHPLPKGKVDLYYLGIDRKRARFDQGIGRESRHSIGARIWGRTKDWDYNTEAGLPMGQLRTGIYSGVDNGLGYRLPLRIDQAPSAIWVSKLTLPVGTGIQRMRTLGTFNALFPKGAYFSEADLLGPYNLMDLHPSVELHLTERISLTSDFDFFWRQSTRRWHLWHPRQPDSLGA